MNRSRRFAELATKVDRNATLPLNDAVARVCELASAKFDESVDASIRLGVDPRHAEQQVRGTVVLPHGTGTSVRVIVFAQGDLAKEAQEAGADLVGGKELADRIKEGWLEFDAAVAAPDMMGIVGPLGRVLGPRGLMPNPKSGTVTRDVGKAVREAKAGKIEYRVDRGANVHAAVGKVSFGPDKILENLTALLESIARARPSGLKGRYLNNVAISSTMGPGIKVDPQSLTDIFK